MLKIKSLHDIKRGGLSELVWNYYYGLIVQET